MPGGSTGGSWDFDDVELWAAEARARDAVDARVRERWLRRQAEDEATFAGVLLDVAERGAAVVVVTTGGHRLVGHVEVVGTDFAAVRTAGARTTLVTLTAVAAVRLSRGGPGGRGGNRLAPAADARLEGRARAVIVTVADVLAHAVAQRPRVQVQAGSGLVVGELRAVGTDVVSVHTDGDPPGLAYVRLASVSEISLLDSG